MMSKEAKIGLLFSLVFIIALAVILRSVHQDGTEAIADNSIMKVDKSPIANTDLSSTIQALTEDPKPQPKKLLPVRKSDPVITNHNQLTTDTYRNEPNQNMIHDADETIRHIQPLPGSSDRNSTVRTYPPTGQVKRAINSMNSTLYSDRAQNHLGQNSIVTTPSAKIDTPEAKPKNVIHTVVSGDNLTKIAMKYYGKNEGNRLVNIEKIFEANKDILSSISDLKIGQRLNIPQLPGIDINQPTAKSDKTTKNSSKSYKVYVVKEDDSLWKIAAKELGNGARYHEITKINASILSDENTLRPGMKLKLPK